MLLAQQESRPLIEFKLAPLFEDFGIPLAVTGILVVFLALALVVMFISLLPWITSTMARVSGSDRRESKAQQIRSDDDIPEELKVVIAAAVAETIREPQRIVRIRGLTPEDLGWSLEGRIQHHQSHRIQRRDNRR